MSFKIDCIDCLVSNWDSVNGAGTSQFSKGGFNVGEYDSIKAALIGAADRVGFDHKHLTNNIFNDDGLINLSVIENGAGLQDNNGAYLCDYIFEVNKCTMVDYDALKEGLSDE